MQLESPLVAVNYQTCEKLANLLSAQSVPKDFEEIDFGNLTDTERGNLLFVVTAICHQTSPVAGPRLEGNINGVTLFGWDYLLKKYLQRATAERQLLSPKAWAKFTEKEIVRLFRDEVAGDTLTGCDVRAALIRDMGAAMARFEWANVGQIRELCHGRIASGEPNILALLSTFKAYRDPVQKKSLFFLALMRNTGLWKFADSNLLGPPVDYHEVRGHLRIGTVKVIDHELQTKIERQIAVDEREDIAIRSAVFDAIMYISEKSQVRDPSRLHYFFWNIFRAVCTRVNPACTAPDQPQSLPMRYRSDFDARGIVPCKFEALCKSAHLGHPILEHHFDTDFY